MAATFGGNLIGCQAASAVIDFMIANDILNHVKNVGNIKSN